MSGANRDGGGLERWKGRVALVTGASSGIGAAICRAFVQHGITVIGCARNIEPIKEMSEVLRKEGYPGSLTAIRCDLSKSVQIDMLFSQLRERYNGIDICINNAGLALPGSLLDGARSAWQQIIDVNLMAVAHCCQLAVKAMKQRDTGEGLIVNINSMAGHDVYPFGDIHVYTMSKYGLNALTKGLRQELQGQSPTIRVSQISPGLVATDFGNRMYSGTKSDMENMMQKYGMGAHHIADMVVFMLNLPGSVRIDDVIMEPTQQPTHTEN